MDDAQPSRRFLVRGVCLFMAFIFEAAATVPVLQSPPQAAVNAAIATSLISYGRNYSGAYTNGSFYGGASIALAVASYAGNYSSDARLLTQIRHSIIGSNAICANGGYPSQHELHATGMFAIARRTPRIWNNLNATERAKIDLLMRASLIANAFTTSDNNPFVLANTGQRTLDGDGNVNRGWNPNYREGMIGSVLVGMSYFGGPAAADSILLNYNHSAFVAELLANGLSNTHTVFNWKTANPTSAAPTGAQIESAVRNYRFFTNPITNYMALYNSLVTDTYGKNVNAGLNNGAGVGTQGGGKILSGASTLPNLGVLGMLKEFESGDGGANGEGGPRSSALYAYEGYRPHQTNQLVLIVSGHWQRGSGSANAAVARMKVGNTDLDYKLQMGYLDYFKGATRSITGLEFPLFDVPTNAKFKDAFGYAYVWPLWKDVLLPYHDGTSSVVPLPPTQDSDGDGTPDFVEYRLGLNPNSGTSWFFLKRFGNTLVWPSAVDGTFTIQRSGNLSSWQNIATVTGAAAATAYTDPSPPPGQAFYRVGLNP